MNMKKLVAALAVAFMGPGNIVTANGQTTEQESCLLGLETDPSTFFFNGYAAHLRYKPAGSHFNVGLGVYALDYPGVMVDMNSDNRSKGWQVRINSAYGLFGEYYFKASARGWYVGMQISQQNFRIGKEGASGKTNFSNLLLMPSIGYTWMLPHTSFYLKPWFGIGYTGKISGTNTVNAQYYSISSVVPFFTLHAGYYFKLKRKL
jgi:hypothetical protein